MNRFLEKLNLLGVLALAALCVLQWRANRSANLDVAGFRKQNAEQSAHIADQKKSIDGVQSDLEVFRAQLTAAKSSEKDVTAKLAAAETSVRELTADREALQTSLTNWVAAVRERDQELVRAATELKTAAAARDEAIEKHNALAEKLNSVIEQHNRLVANLANLTNSAPKN